MRDIERSNAFLQSFREYLERPVINYGERGLQNGKGGWGKPSFIPSEMLKGVAIKFSPLQSVCVGGEGAQNVLYLDFPILYTPSH